MSTTPSPVLPKLLAELAEYKRVRERLVAFAIEDPNAVMLYLQTLILSASELPGGDLLQDLQDIASHTLADTAKQAASGTTH
jgi:hypothetical protein